jgi:hypothetical protein
MQKSKPQSKQAHICTTIGMELFSLFQHQSAFLKQLLKMKTNIDQSLNTPCYKEITSSEQKSRRKMKAKCSIRKREHSLNDKSEN